MRYCASTAGTAVNELSNKSDGMDVPPECADTLARAPSSDGIDVRKWGFVVTI